MVRSKPSKFSSWSSIWEFGILWLGRWCAIEYANGGIRRRGANTYSRWAGGIPLTKPIPRGNDTKHDERDAKLSGASMPAMPSCSMACGRRSRQIHLVQCRWAACLQFWRVPLTVENLEIHRLVFSLLFCQLCWRVVCIAKKQKV